MICRLARKGAGSPYNEAKFFDKDAVLSPETLQGTASPQALRRAFREHGQVILVNGDRNIALFALMIPDFRVGNIKTATELLGKGAYLIQFPGLEFDFQIAYDPSRDGWW